MARRKKKLVLIFLLLLGGAIIFLSDQAEADDQAPLDLRAKIEEKNREIKKLEAEAEQYRATLQDIGEEVNSLQSQIQGIERTLKRLTTSIRLTNAKIVRTNLEIAELSQGIQEKEASIGKRRGELGYFVQTLAASDQETPVEIFLEQETISSFFRSVDAILSIQRSIHTTLAELRKTREALEERKTETERKKLELARLVLDLSDQKTLQEYERRERTTLLAETKNQEQRYLELIAEAERRREALQEEIRAFEAGLTATFDRSLLPRASSGVLGWPLPDPIFITQYFGRTAFARAGGYNGKGHNGIDLRAAAGTPVFSSHGGIVRAGGDTDTACRRASYGRWIVIDHDNNLSTLYAHLSLIKVRAGEAVNRGELIGYSGRTGYATGPHLHFTVFAKPAVQIIQFPSRVCRRTMSIPRSPFPGYLNPLDYL